MDRWLMELGSPPGEGPVRGGGRQARAALRLVNRDPTVKRLILIEALALTALWVAFYLRWKGGSAGPTAHALDEWLYWLAASGIAAASSLAIACAVDVKIDGAGGDLRLVGSEVRRRLPTLLGWWAISIVLLLALEYAATAAIRPLPAIVVVGLVWGFASLFVTPAIALGGRGPLKSIGEAVRLLRERWGRALAGLFVIGLLAAVFLIACGFMLRAADHRSGGHDQSVWRLGGALFLFYTAYALIAAARGAFGVILARDALGDLPGEAP
jgi:hypothetical protein